MASEAERKKLEERTETEGASDCLSIELNILSQILKRDLQPNEIEWIRNEIEKRKSVKKTDNEESVPHSRAEYESVLRVGELILC